MGGTHLPAATPSRYPRVQDRQQKLQKNIKIRNIRSLLKDSSSPLWLLKPWVLGERKVLTSSKVWAAVKDEKRSTSFLFQRLGIAVQRGNAASILGTLPSSSEIEEIYYLC